MMNDKNDVVGVEVDDDDDDDNDMILWKVGDPIPTEFLKLQQHPSEYNNGTESSNDKDRVVRMDHDDNNHNNNESKEGCCIWDPIRSTLIPRPIAWFCVTDDNVDHDKKNQCVEQQQQEQQHYVSILDGYTAACYTPPTIFFAASALPLQMYKLLQRTQRCTLSVITTRDDNENRFQFPSNDNKNSEEDQLQHQKTATTTSTCNVHSDIVPSRDSSSCSTSGSSRPSAGRNPLYDDSQNNNPSGTGQPQCYPVQKVILPFTKRIQKEMYPPTLQWSPIQMYCTLNQIVSFDDDADNDHDADDDDTNNIHKKSHPSLFPEAMVVLTIEHFVIDKGVIVPTEPPPQLEVTSTTTTTPKTSQLPPPRSILGTIEAHLVQPLVHMGNQKYVPLRSVWSMPRPLYNKEKQQWTSTSLHLKTNIITTIPPPPSTTTTTSIISSKNHDDDHDHENNIMEWTHRTDGPSCSLGFCPTIALIMPRPIGWISTYSAPPQLPEEAVESANGTSATKTTTTTSPPSSDETKGKDKPLLHLAPYSFFIDVARGKRPKVAFSAYQATITMDDGVTTTKKKKDAQLNAEYYQYFCCNMVTTNNIVAMNYSAAELNRTESEFQLANLLGRDGRFLPPDSAPYVVGAPVVYECRYIKTIDISNFAIVIGEIVGIAFSKQCICSTSRFQDAIEPKKDQHHHHDDPTSTTITTNISKRQTTTILDTSCLQPIARLGYTDEYGLF